jgi:hypothetical protein
MQVRIFNPPSPDSLSPNGTWTRDSTKLDVDALTVENVMAAMKARKWYFTPGLYVAVDTDEARSFGAALVFEVEEIETKAVEFRARPAA